MSKLNHARIRSNILFIVGVGGVIYELVVTGTDRPALLILLGMFAGLPIVFNADKLLHNLPWAQEDTAPKPEIEKKPSDDEKVDEEGS